MSNIPRGERRNVFVTIGSIKYGFKTSSRTKQHATTLGHQDAAAANGVIYGINSPKPNRATLISEKGLGRISSFIDPGKEKEARKANWTITRTGGRRAIGESRTTIAVYVNTPFGWKYAWRMQKADFSSFGAILGIKKATAADADDLVWGANNPKPPRASKLDNGSVNSSFIEPSAATIDKAFAAGWNVSGINYELIPAAEG